MSKEPVQERLEREREKVGEKKASVVCKWVEVKRGSGVWGGGVQMLDAQSSCVRTV